ncbi:hypothetical protein N9M10_05230 [Hellea sp.]|nr:hypothetical protein [Hellea sp.]
MRLISKRTMFPRLDAVITSIEQTVDWTTTTASNDCHFHQLSICKTLGLLQPFTSEQSALHDYLMARQADKRLCNYAWRLYSQSLA